MNELTNRFSNVHLEYVPTTDTGRLLRGCLDRNLTMTIELNHLFLSCFLYVVIHPCVCVCVFLGHAAGAAA